MSSRSLGVLTLDLVAKTAGFTGPLDKAGRDFDKRANAMQKTATEMGKAIGNALTVGAGLAAAGMALYIRNTMEAEKVQAQLASRIKDTGAAAGRSLQQLNEQADKLQGVTIFDDEAIGGVQAMLLTFKEIQGVNFDAATAAVLDLSTAMGVDAQSAALQLGKALNDPIRGLSALGRAGVQFSADQKKLIKDMVEAGGVAGAQRVILAELEGQMGSAAEAARNTLSGALQGLRNNFDNLLEGDTSGGGLKGTVDAVNDLSNELNDPALKEGIDALAGGLLRAGSAALQGTANVANFLSSINTVLANAGAVPGKEIAQLQARREQLSKALTGTVVGRMFPESVKGELAEIDKEIQQYIAGNWYEGAAPAAGLMPKGHTASGSTGSGKGKKDRAPREALDLTKGAADELQRMVELEAQARESFDGMLATLSGPLAEANFQYQQQLEELNQTARDGGIATAELTQAQDLLRQQHDANVEAIGAIRSPTQQMMEDMQFELELIGLTNAEREKAIALRHANADAASIEGQRISELVDELHLASEAEAVWGDFKAGMSDAFVDFATGAKSAKEAIGDFFDDLFKRAVQAQADKWIDQLFSSFGSGSGGGDSGSLMGLFSGEWGFSKGGYTGPGSKHKVAGVVHAGEYVLNAESVRKVGTGFLDQLNRGWTGEAGPERHTLGMFRLPMPEVPATLFLQVPA